jgi:hypothetical protein
MSGNHPNTFDENGIHKGTGTRYDKNGYDKDGYDKNGYWEHDEIHNYMKTKFSPGGYNRDGVN